MQKFSKYVAGKPLLIIGREFILKIVKEDGERPTKTVKGDWERPTILSSSGVI